MADGAAPLARLIRWGRLGWSAAGAVIGAALVVLVAGVLLPLVLPLLVMAVIGATLQPVVDRLRRRGAPAWLAALAGALAVPALLVGLVLLFGYAVTAHMSRFRHIAEQAGARLHELFGADPVRALRQLPGWHTVLAGAGSILTGSVVVAGQLVAGVLLGGYLLFYTFRDGPRCLTAIEGRVPVRPGRLRQVTTVAAYQFRRYMLGTTLIAVMDAAVITFGAVLLRLPLVGTIAMLTFVAAYVPYLGAWVSAGFAVLVALGAGGVSTGLWMLAIVLVTQNVLEGILRPGVFGRALGLHPVVVLAVTVLGAAVGGLCGVFLAPPLTAIFLSWRKALGGAP